MVESLKQEAQRLLAEVPEEKSFWANDGRIFRNMKQLREALNEMSDDTYIYHANIQKHDFSNWVKDVIGDDILAANLHNALTRTQAVRAITSRINILSKRLR